MNPAVIIAILTLMENAVEAIKLRQQSSAGPTPEDLEINKRAWKLQVQINDSLTPTN